MQSLWGVGRPNVSRGTLRVEETGMARYKCNSTNHSFLPVELAR